MMTNERLEEIRQWIIDAGIVTSETWIWQALKDCVIEIDKLRDMTDTVRTYEQPRCQWCDTSLKSSWNFCIKCGAKLYQLGDKMINPNLNEEAQQLQETMRRIPTLEFKEGKK